MPFDVRNEPDWENAMAMATVRFGGLDILVNMGSVLGRVGAAGFAAYGASKARCWRSASRQRLNAAERGFPIRVNLVAPGFTKTPMTEIMIGLLPVEEQIGTYDKLAALHPLERFASTAYRECRAVPRFKGHQLHDRRRARRGWRPFRVLGLPRVRRIHRRSMGICHRHSA